MILPLIASLQVQHYPKPHFNEPILPRNKYFLPDISHFIPFRGKSGENPKRFNVKREQGKTASFYTYSPFKYLVLFVISY